MFSPLEIAQGPTTTRQQSPNITVTQGSPLDEMWVAAAGPSIELDPCVFVPPPATDELVISLLQPGLESSINAPSLAVSRRSSCVPPGLPPVGHGLHIGAFREVNDQRLTDAAGIKAYLCVAREIAMPPHIDANQIAKGDVAFLHLPLADNATTNLRDHFAAIFNFIDEQAAHGRPVAIYCQQGKSRSVSFALAYLMYKSKLSVEAALSELRSTYRRADPNVFFLAQLAEWSALGMPLQRAQ